MVGCLLIDEVLNCRDLIVAKVAEAELVLNLFENVDKLGDVIVAKVLLWVFLQDFEIKVIKDFLSLNLRSFLCFLALETVC